MEQENRSVKSKLEVYEDKKKVAAFLLGSMIFVVIGLLVQQPSILGEVDPLMNLSKLLGTNEELIVIGARLIIWLGIILFFYGTIVFMFRITRNDPVLVINGEGIVENSMSYGYGLIRWDQINSIKIKQIANYETKMYYLVIYLTVNDLTFNSFRTRLNSAVRKLLNPFNIDNMMLQIPLNTMKVDKDLLERKIKHFQPGKLAESEEKQDKIL